MNSMSGCICVYFTYFWCRRKLNEGNLSPGTGVEIGCKRSQGLCEEILRPLQEFKPF